MCTTGKQNAQDDAPSARRVGPVWGRAILCGIVLGGCFCTAVVLLLRGGILGPESRSFVAHYISEKPLLEKLLDLNVNELMMYQARELSYAFDYVDAQCIRLSIHLGYPHFLSLTGLLFVTAILVATARYSAAELRMEWSIVTLVLILYLSSPSTLFLANVGRTAKVGVALTTVLGWQLIHRQLLNPMPPSPWYKPWLALLTLGFTASIFDRQGFYILAMCCVALGVHTWTTGTRQSLVLLTAASTAFVMSVLYNLVIGPHLIHRVVHYWPNFAYQRIPMEEFIAAPFTAICTGAGLVLDYFRFFVGNLTTAQAMVAFVLIFWLAARSCPELSVHGKRRRWAQYNAPILLGILLVMLVLMTTLMAQRHWAVTYDDLRRIIYAPPSVALFLGLLLWLLSTVCHREVLSTTGVRLLLVVAVFCNIASLPGHLRIIRSGSFEPSIARSAMLLEGLRHVWDERYVPTPELSNDWFYQMFREHELYGRPFRFTGVHWEELQ
jgi:hypothetical protein